MFSVIEHIEYLLTHHDCVAVPGWGAFIANYKSALYEADREMMQRPQRTIGFNANLVHNDGLLVQSLMRREGLTYDQAMRFIADSVVTFRKQLSANGEVPMGRLGYFLRNKDSYNEFVPFNNADAVDQFYGLADVEVKTVDALERSLVESLSKSETTAPVVVPDRGLFSRKGMRIAASVAVLIGLSVMLSTPVIVDRSYHNMAAVAPEITAPQPQQLAPTVQQGVVTQEITTVDAYQGIAGTGNTSGKYYMVIATLRNQQELDAFKAKYASLAPYMKMMDYKGMTCVYVARSDDYAQLMSLRGELPERLRDIWIYN